MNATATRLRTALTERLLILDGAMGTALQAHHLDEDAYRGQRFSGHPQALAGDHDLLCVTQPDIVRSVHEAYLEAGAESIDTNTFAATSIAPADYGLSEHPFEMNVRAAQPAKEAAASCSTCGRRRFVAGASGPA